MQTCTKCKNEKSNEEMRVGRKICKECYNNDRAIYREMNREKTRQATRNWMNKNKDEILSRRRDKYPEKKKLRDAMKQTLVNLRGGCCFVCGYKKCLSALEFHHTDPTKKDFTVSHNMKTEITQDILNEVNKCVILCANCHREVHQSIIFI